LLAPLFEKARRRGESEGHARMEASILVEAAVGRLGGDR
jgi:hypothetical protein